MGWEGLRCSPPGIGPERIKLRHDADPGKPLSCPKRARRPNGGKSTARDDGLLDETAAAVSGGLSCRGR